MLEDSRQNIQLFIKIHQNKNIIKPKPWITTGLLLSIKKKLSQMETDQKCTLELETRYKNYRNFIR